ncbi:hypothetical protein Pcinc_044413 [Petrolisthes cinctipes]|uniref:Uncharacterized protein n=1 Tax=Petrolisthes cinctipes TaxID=88211 RepID=A0AAE1BDW9_PETCI|nr:hypothetical protein Pcinc_044413 [Petrolisthes cinctipes]
MPVSSSFHLLQTFNCQPPSPSTTYKPPTASLLLLQTSKCLPPPNLHLLQASTRLPLRCRHSLSFFLILERPWSSCLNTTTTTTRPKNPPHKTRPIEHHEDARKILV